MNDWKNFVKIDGKSRKDNLPIQIGHSIVVDGYIPYKKNAVFTHFHQDHMGDIDDTLSYDKVLLHPITYNVAIALNSTRKWRRRNLKSLNYREVHTTKFGEEITLYDADHIAGSCQVHVKVDNTRILYSGDFNFPSADTPKCDILVLDATHGVPQFNTKTDKDSILNSLFFEINKVSSKHPVVIIAARGSLQEIMNHLDKGVENEYIDGDIPFIANSDEITIKNVLYSHESNTEREFLDYSTPEAFRIIKNKSKCIIFRTVLHQDNELENMHTVIVDKYSAFHKEHAFFEPNEKLLRINLLSHSSYDGILEYVKKNEPKFVITDSSRSSYSTELAKAITKDFGFPAISYP